MARHFGVTHEEIAAVCKQYIDVGGKGIRKMLGIAAAEDGPWHEAGG